MGLTQARNYCYIFIFLAFSAHAAEYTFTSKIDKFTVDVSDGQATYNGEQVSSEPFKLIKPLFDFHLAEGCDKGLGKPDLTITRKRGDADEKRIVYIEKKIVSDGENCGDITGHGLYELPLHHNWFIENKNVTIGLKNAFSIYKDNMLVVAFEKVNGKWRNKDPQFATNWTYFEKFVEGMKQIPIDFRVHPAAAKAYTHFELRQDGRSFSFVKVGESTWAVKFPDSPWYSASGQLGFLEDMSAKVWTSQNSGMLSIVTDRSAAEEKRITAIRAAGEKWGPDSKIAFFTVLESDGESPNVIREIAAFLRNKPTDENYKAIVSALKNSHDPDLQNYLTKILRLKNPKGPTISPDDPDDVVKTKINAWLAWKKTLN